VGRSGPRFAVPLARLHDRVALPSRFSTAAIALILGVAHHHRKVTGVPFVCANVLFNGSVKLACCFAVVASKVVYAIAIVCKVDDVFRAKYNIVFLIYSKDCAKARSLGVLRVCAYVLSIKSDIKFFSRRSHRFSVADVYSGCAPSGSSEGLGSAACILC
jgi:hypothetical protein